METELLSLFKYREVTDLIGKKFTVTSIEALEDSLRTVVTPHVETFGSLRVDILDLEHHDKTPSFVGAFGKYRVLDLTCDVNQTTECPIAGRQAAESMCLVPHLGPPSPGDPPEYLFESLDRHIAQIKKDNTLVLLLFIEDPAFSNFNWRHNEFNLHVTSSEYDKCKQYLNEKSAQTGISQEDFSFWQNIMWGFVPAVLPLEMQIKDACITNFRSVWSEKHFYL